MNRIDTIIGNRVISERLKGMLSDLRNSMSVVLDRVEEIKVLARSEGLEDHETFLLLKSYLCEFLNRDQVRYVLLDGNRRKKQKKLRENMVISYTDANMSMERQQVQEEKISIPTDYKVVIPDWVLEEETKQLEREQKQQEDTESVNEVFEEFNQ